MRITIETSSWAEVQRIVTMLKSLEISNVNVIGEEGKITSISKGDKTIDPQSLFGIWKDHPRDLNKIRKSSWNRNWDV